MNQSGVPQPLTGLFGGFEGHRAPSEPDIATAIRSALISLDANVLLGLYRYPDETTAAMLETLEAYEDRVFVSHQAQVEFWRNRTSALADRGRARIEVEQRINSTERSIVSALEEWAKKTAMAELERKETLIAVARQFDVLRRVVEDNHEDDVEIYPSPSMDPIVQSLNDLLTGRVGLPLAPDDYAAAVSEGKRRHAAGEPPGFKEKLAEKDALPEGVSGDYLVWVQSMREAQRRDLDLLLLTADEKEDWYWRSKDTVIGPRPELGKEFWDATGRRLFLLTPMEYLRRHGGLYPDASDVHLFEEDTSLFDVEERIPTRSESGLWSLNAVMQLLTILDTSAPVQAEAIRFAASHGGTIQREDIYRLGRYSPRRTLRGFTRPVRRVSRILQERGELDPGAPDMLQPRYDHGVQANAFDVPEEAVTLLQR